MAHTPGPWEDACDSYGRVRHSRKYQCVYTTEKNAAGSTTRIITIASRIENEEDARLIAAAPDLLAACEFTIQWFTDAGYPHAAPIARLREAVAKAAPNE